MNTTPLITAAHPALPVRALRIIGMVGTVLAIVILGASVALRLNSGFGADGHVFSTLSPVLESVIRQLHRLAASSVGLLVIGSLALCWRRRPLPAAMTRPVMVFTAVTAFLSVIGPLTPGYRYSLVTVGNVLGGIVLAMAFWWLREAATGRLPMVPARAPLPRASIVISLLHVAFGAAASAHEMRGERGFAFLHLGSALLFTMVIGATLLHHRHDEASRGWRLIAVVLLVAQILAGAIMLPIDMRPPWIAFAHAMLTPVFAMALVSIALQAPAVRAASSANPQ